MAEVFDLETLPAYRWAERQKNVFFAGRGFRTRIVELAPGETQPGCRMESSVIFVALRGEGRVRVDGTEFALADGKCLVTAPATVEMSSARGARLLGIQVTVPVAPREQPA
jgi:mannose-6-phosphate isomerase-like protein (cupin superfamily)